MASGFSFYADLFLFSVSVECTYTVYVSVARASGRGIFNLLNAAGVTKLCRKGGLIIGFGFFVSSINGIVYSLPLSGNSCHKNNFSAVHILFPSPLVAPLIF
jgi:hypothetical protein